MAYDYAEKIFDYEDGELDEAQEIELFQYLIDNRLIEHLQGHYGRQARQLIDAGLCHEAS